MRKNTNYQFRLTGKKHFYRIHPGIGLGRVGNAPSDFFYVGPENLGSLGTEPDGTPLKYPKTTNDDIRRQAVRFRIWKYEKQGSKYHPKEELLPKSDSIRIVWIVQLANKKASFFEFKGLKGSTPANPNPSRRNSTKADRYTELVIDSAPRSIYGKNKKGSKYHLKAGNNVQFSRIRDNWAGGINYLGELRTDDQGRLIVIGGEGKSNFKKVSASDRRKLSDYANNNGWFDDVSDGFVIANIYIKPPGSDRWNPPIKVRNENASWVLFGPPNYAPGIRGVVSIYDTLYDVAARELNIPNDLTIYDREPWLSLKKINQTLKMTPDSLSAFTPNFDADINPVLLKTIENRWVNAKAHAFHTASVDANKNPNLKSTASSAEPVRKHVFTSLRKPYDLTSLRIPNRNMPKMHGDAHDSTGASTKDKYLTLTITQYLLMKNWAEGNFSNSSIPPSADLTPEIIDRAALEDSIGGAFFPGIEASWLIRNKDVFLEPFRLDVAGLMSSVPTIDYYSSSVVKLPLDPGFFTQQMALPWHADFTSCAEDGGYAWWPSIRPDQVWDDAKSKMVPWFRKDPTSEVEIGGSDEPHRRKVMTKHWAKMGILQQLAGQYIDTLRGKI